MSDLSNATVDEVVQRMQELLDAGAVGYHGLYSRNQSDYRDMWTELFNRVHDESNEDFDNPTLVKIRSWMNELGDRAPQAPEPFAVNTTFYGDVALKNHAPNPASESSVEDIQG